METQGDEVSRAYAVQTLVRGLWELVEATERSHNEIVMLLGIPLDSQGSLGIRKMDPLGFIGIPMDSAMQIVCRFTMISLLSGFSGCYSSSDLKIRSLQSPSHMQLQSKYKKASTCPRTLSSRQYSLIYSPTSQGNNNNRGTLSFFSGARVPHLEQCACPTGCGHNPNSTRQHSLQDGCKICHHKCSFDSLLFLGCKHHI